MKKLNNLHSNQDGIVAIAVSLIILLIVSLMTLGFARLMQREQRQALDRQLSTQAFYAAESAINDARQELKSGKQIEKNNCPENSDISKKGGTLSSDGAIDYTCLLVNSALPDIRYSDIGSEVGRQVAIQTSTGAPVSRIRIEWERDPSYTDFGATTSLPPYVQWPADRPDMLRVVIFTRNGSGYDSRTFFLTPAANDSTGTVEASYSSPSNPEIVLGRCSQAGSASREYTCRADITGNFLTNKRANSGDQGDTIVAMTTVYRKDKPTPIRIQAFNAGATTTDNQRLLVNSQYRIDATGKANDVYRRLQVRVSQALDYYTPERAIETTQTICKRFITEPSETRADESDGCLP